MEKKNFELNFFLERRFFGGIVVNVFDRLEIHGQTIMIVVKLGE